MPAENTGSEHGVLFPAGGFIPKGFNPVGFNEAPTYLTYLYLTNLLVVLYGNVDVCPMLIPCTI